MKKYFLFLLSAFFLNSQVLSESTQYYCDINALQNKDFSKDALGYYQDDYAKVFPDWLAKANNGDKKYQFYIAKTYQFGHGVEKDLYKSFEWYTKSSEQGYPLAKNNLSLLYLEGQVTEVDHNKKFELLCDAAIGGLSLATMNIAHFYYDINVNDNRFFEWLLKSAMQGNSRAQYDLAVAYLKGAGGIAISNKKALEWIQKSANQGFVPAQNRLGNFYEYGDNVTKDLKLAFNWYQKAANQGDVYGQITLAGMYQYGQGVTKDLKRAFKWYQKAAKQGDAIAQYNLGWKYAMGDGVSEDLQLAFSWYQKAAKQGEPRAQIATGSMYKSGDGVTKNLKLGFSWFQKAANSGNSYAQAYLGNEYQEGIVVKKDLKQAVEWYQKAAEQGNAAGQSSLGYMYSYGLGVSKDLKLAFSWYKKAAEQGDDLGQYNLGNCYEYGKGVTKDLKQALSWYQKAADQGYASGQAALATMYQYGRYVNIDLKQAVNWYQKAADQGNAYSQSSLGYFYETGQGVNKDLKQALSWYQKAADQGDEYAIKNLAALETSINAIQGQEDNDNNVSKIDTETALQINSLPPGDSSFEIELWNSVKDSSDPDEYQIYVDEFPEGRFVKLAQLRIKKYVNTSIPEFDYGNYHALVIGNDSYSAFKSLSNAVNDANDVASLLRSKYNFNVEMLTNATRYEIVSALSNLRNSVSAKDSILIYYAGHGILDTETDEGFWLPIDAVEDNDVHWISNETIMRSVRRMKAKHVMVVADSCFSGTLTRGVTIKDNSPNYIKKIIEKKSRTVLTSGGLEPVSDVGGGNNSVFASGFLNALRNNNGVLDGNQLFSIIRKQVMLNSDQTPEYGDIRKSGHDGGDFIFVSE
jgi:TPR repeat protein